MSRLFMISIILVLLSLTACAQGDSTDYPLAEPGPYHVGVIKMVTYVDENWGDREVTLTIWYPTASGEASGIDALTDAPSDMSGAPYPLILSSTKMGFIFAPLIVSHGFTYMGVNTQDSKSPWGNFIIDYPREMLFGFLQLATNPPALLAGVIDSDTVGATGYSFDSFTSLVLGGARVDPEYYLDKCEKAKPKDPIPPEWWIEYICTPSYNWQAFSDNAGEAITSSSDGLWQPITDDRIKAVIPMAPEGAWMFGERGLAAVDIPVMIIGAEDDEANFYDLEASVIFRNLGAEEKVMITFLDQGHMMVYDQEMIARMKHFAVAFFGYHLQGNEAMAEFFSKDFVLNHAGLDWGIH